MRVTSKAEFFRLWRLGVLGNRTNLWDHVEDAIKSGCTEIGFREIGKAGGGAWTKVPREQARSVAVDWTGLGRKFIMDDSVPNDKQTLIGEICRTIRGLEGYLGVTTLPMRPAMKAGLLLPRTGATVLALLDRYMDPSSRDDLNDLMDLFPDSTIEFACYSVDVGCFPNRQTMFWEIRNY